MRHQSPNSSTASEQAGITESQEPWHDVSRSVAERVDSLLAQMTVEEKAGQLGSFWAQEPTSGGDVAPMHNAMAEEGLSLAESISHGLGHLTRVFGSHPVTAAEGIAAMRNLQDQVTRASRFGIGAIAHEECLAGFTALGATIFPIPLSWGATFNPELVAEMAAAIGTDMRAVGVHQGLAPVLDVVRDYRWGRVEETISEDPYLVGVIGTAYVRGLQSAGVIATVKHFAGYSAARAARNHAPVPIGRRELADVILPPFEMAVRDGEVGSVMNSYSDIDGEAPAASHGLLTDLLRKQWGFTGTVVSDYWALSFLQLMHRVAADLPDAGRLSLEAGMDVELPQTAAFQHLPELVRTGQLSQAVLDEAARRVLTQKAELGLLDATWQTEPDEIDIDLDPAGNRGLAAQLAQESIVLLANDGALPLAANSQRIAVIGPSAIQPRTFLGCYSFPNHVLARMSEAGTGVEIPSLLKCVDEEWPSATVEHEFGCPITETDRSRIPAAAELAARSDVAIVTVGDLAGLFGGGTSGEGCDVEDLSLPGAQGDLIEAALATDTPVVLVVISGRPYALGDYADRCRAIVQAFFPGEEGAGAIAGVLSGRLNPSGRLPVAVPRNPGGQPSTYLAPPLGQQSQGVSNLDPTPLFPFGHGLSYTSVEYGKLALSSHSIATDGVVEAAVTMTNTGARSTEEVIQLYLSDHVAQVARPVHELVGFARVSLEPGQSRRVTFSLHAERTSFTGLSHRRIVEPGWFTLSSGPSVGDLRDTASFEITGEVREMGGPRVMTTPYTISETAHR